MLLPLVSIFPWFCEKVLTQGIRNVGSEHVIKAKDAVVAYERFELFSQRLSGDPLETFGVSEDSETRFFI